VANFLPDCQGNLPARSAPFCSPQPLPFLLLPQPLRLPAPILSPGLDYFPWVRRWPGIFAAQLAALTAAAVVVAASNQRCRVRQFLSRFTHSFKLKRTFNQCSNSLPPVSPLALGSVAAPAFRCRSALTGPVAWGPRHARFGHVHPSPRPRGQGSFACARIQDFGIRPANFIQGGRRRLPVGICGPIRGLFGLESAQGKAAAAGTPYGSFQT